MEDKQRILVVTGADECGNMELVALEGGLRESSVSRREVLYGLRKRGLESEPELLVRDGALGASRKRRPKFFRTPAGKGTGFARQRTL